MFAMDLGRNQFSGQLPDDLGEQFIRLRHLFLDHNKFDGTLPSSFVTVGNGRLESLAINHNRLTGDVPSNFDLTDKLGKWKARCKKTCIT